MDQAESSDEEAAASDAKHVVVAWWKDDISGLLSSLAAFAPRGSVISIVCEDQPEVTFGLCMAYLQPSNICDTETVIRCSAVPFLYVFNAFYWLCRGRK